MAMKEVERKEIANEFSLLLGSRTEHLAFPQVPTFNEP